MKKFITLAVFAGLMATLVPAADAHTRRHYRRTVVREVVYTGRPAGYYGVYSGGPYYGYGYDYAPYGYGYGYPYGYGYGLSVGLPLLAFGFGHHHHFGHHFHGHH